MKNRRKIVKKLMKKGRKSDEKSTKNRRIIDEKSTKYLPKIDIELLTLIHFDLFHIQRKPNHHFYPGNHILRG